MALDAGFSQPAGIQQPAEPAGRYPVHLDVDIPSRNSRWWAFPVLGIVIKAIILIPHLICLYVLGIVVEVLQLGLWIPVLINGTYPDFGYAVVGGYLRWNLRVTGYFLGLTDRYPPFSMRSAPNDVPYPVQIRFEVPPRNNRFWAIPVLGFFVKLLILIPHMIILSVLGSVVGLVMLVLWIPVLFAGKYPRWGYQLVGGWMRWSLRVSAYLFGLTDRYPPFEL